MRNPFHILANFLECQLIRSSKCCRVPPMHVNIVWIDGRTFPAVAINSVLTTAANILHFLDLEAICPNSRFSFEGES